MEPDNSHLLGEALYGETPVMIVDAVEEPDKNFLGCMDIILTAYALNDTSKTLFTAPIDKFTIEYH